MLKQDELILQYRDALAAQQLALQGLADAKDNFQHAETILSRANDNVSNAGAAVLSYARGTMSIPAPPMESESVLSRQLSALEAAAIDRAS